MLIIYIIYNKIFNCQKQLNSYNSRFFNQYFIYLSKKQLNYLPNNNIKIMNIHTEQNTSKLYDMILYLYRQQGYQSHSLVTFYKTKRIFDSQSQKILEQDFKSQILQQAWEHVQSSNSQQKQVIKITQAWVEAYRIINSRISAIQSKNGILQDYKIVLKDRTKQLQGYRNQQNDYKIKRIIALQSDCQYMQRKINQIQANYSVFKEQLDFINTVLVFNQRKIPKLIKQSLNISRRRESLDNIDVRNKLLESQSKGLKWIFYFTFFGIICQLTGMTLQTRKSLFPIFVFLLGIQVLFIGFIKYRIVFYLVALSFLSVAIDLFYYYLNMVCNMWSIKIVHQIMLCPFQFGLEPFKPISFIFLLISTLIRIITGIQWMKYASIGKKQYYFTIWGMRIELKKRVVKD